MQRLIVLLLLLALETARHRTAGNVLFRKFLITAVERNCVVPLKPDLSYPSPLIFTQTGVLISPENDSREADVITLATGEEVVFSCSPNYFRELSSEKVLWGQCKKDTTFVVNGQDKNFVSALACKERPIEEIIVSVRGCPATLRSIEYGFTNPVSNKSYILGEACYDAKVGRTHFIHTKVRSGTNSIEHLALKVKDNATYFHGYHPTQRYKVDLSKALNINDQVERFRAVFGVKNAPKIESRRYIGESLLTHRQYLSVLKMAWNYQIVKDRDLLLNFDRLLEDIRALEVTEVEIFTGAHGVLTLQDKHNQSAEVYLVTNRFPVPKLHWTVVRSQDKATAIAIFNKPQLTEQEREQNAFCTSVCEQISWLKKLHEADAWQNVRDGYVLCCEVEDFRRTVKEMPPIAGINGLFV
ncbi:uncharacterized protein LOC131282145 [Anopheles ziemanni]|uniref:uncharacterized protein LOC131265485 n=1 Tax=Anopheles coustani TaxID=139045 RepID=UPI002658D370|nr:uncharacterized protein LOC131265485 [Anopheles coustani]XP_058167528.1 uncharacterized protein LOC131282145 [Anopheles ziemanni]